MSTLLYGLDDEITPEQTEGIVRTQDETIRSDDGGAQLDHDPQWGEDSTDGTVELTGPARRDTQGAYHPSVKGPPPGLNLHRDYNAPINDQVASSGTAAARESAGEWGHGTMPYEVSITPANPAEEFGKKRFLRTPSEVQEGARNMMTPIDPNNWDRAVSQEKAIEATRESSMASLYNAAFGG